jgi:hypothetical protein
MSVIHSATWLPARVVITHRELALGFASPTCVGFAFVEDDPRFQQAYNNLRSRFAGE